MNRTALRWSGYIAIAIAFAIACAYLSNDLSGFTTGATININGGLYYQ